MIRSWTGSLGIVMALFACTKQPVREPDEREPDVVETEVIEPAVIEPAVVEPVERPPNSNPLVQHPAAVEGFVETTLPAHWRLAFAPAGATPLHQGVAVALQREGLFVGNERMVTMTYQGLDKSAIAAHVVEPLAERARILAPGLDERAKARGEFWDGQANLYLDPDMLVGDLVDVVYTLGLSGFSHYQIASAPLPGDSIGAQVVSLGLEFSPPRLMDGAPLAEPVQLVVMVTQLNVEFGLQIEGGEINWYGYRRWDQEPMVELERLAAELAHGPAFAETEGPRTAVFIAEPEVRVGLLIEAMNAASGSACSFADALKLKTGNPERCHFAERVLQAAP